MNLVLDGFSCRWLLTKLESYTRSEPFERMSSYLRSVRSRNETRIPTKMSGKNRVSLIAGMEYGMEQWQGRS